MRKLPELPVAVKVTTSDTPGVLSLKVIEYTFFNTVAPSVSEVEVSV